MITVLPEEWEELDLRLSSGTAFRNRKRQLRVVQAVARAKNGMRWHHVSISRTDGALPSYDELCAVKEAFVGPASKVIQILAWNPEPVDVQVVHLFECLDDDDPLQNFSNLAEML